MVFAVIAMTAENYAEARRCYEAAIQLDRSLDSSLQECPRSLDLEEQGDVALLAAAIETRQNSIDGV